tara:strand:- start:326 stop:598 length:273 start_codon:yes stop_codon:yes gene_type:complete
MATQQEIYGVLKEWVDETDRGDFRNFEELRDRFGDLERQVFGETKERVRNPLAMKYDSTRNALLAYSGSKSPKDLELIRQRFLEIPSPGH